MNPMPNQQQEWLPDLLNTPVIPDFPQEQLQQLQQQQHHHSQQHRAPPPPQEQRQHAHHYQQQQQQQHQHDEESVQQWHSEDPSKPGQPKAERSFALPAAAHSTSNATWGDRENELLNYAIRRIVQEHVSEIWAVAPELEPWRPKGRIHRSLNKFMTTAPGGEAAKVRFEAEKSAANARKRAVSAARGAQGSAAAAASGSASGSASKKAKVQQEPEGTAPPQQ